MPLPMPSFIPIRKKEHLAVASWRAATPDPPKDDGCHFTRIALTGNATKEAVAAAVEKAVPETETYHSFLLPSAISIPTKKKNSGAEATTPNLTPTLSPGMNPDAGADADPPEMFLPPAIASTTPTMCFRFGRSQLAEDTKKVLSTTFPDVQIQVTSADNEHHLPTLVLKGLPFNLAPSAFLTQLNCLTTKPSHIRLQRGDRGMFKCIVFIKYPSAITADIAKVELERFMLGGKPIKVEYKKRARRYIAAEPGAADTAQTQLTDLVNELKVSKENEAFTFPKGVLSKDEQKFLKGLCASHDLIFEAPDAVTVRRKQIPSQEAGRSPSVRPAQTPPWQPATPGSLAPQDSSGGLNFRGIRAWKETRANGQNFALGQGLPIARPKGPGDIEPFGAGRGRPIS